MQQPPNLYTQHTQQQWNPQQSPKKKSHKRVWITLAAAALVVAAIIGVASQGQSQKPVPAAQTMQQPATQVPTKKPTQRSTPAQQLSIASNIAVLGGTITAFDNKIGTSNCCTRNGWDDGDYWVGVYTAENGSQWYQAVGEQSNERVVGIYLSPYNTTFNGGTPVWSSTKAKQVC